MANTKKKTKILHEIAELEQQVGRLDDPFCALAVQLTAELERLASALLVGEKSYKYPWVHSRTLERRQAREVPIGAAAEFITRHPTASLHSGLGPGQERSKRRWLRSLGVAIC